MKNNRIERQMKQKVKLKNNKYVYLKLNRRYASLIINSLAFTKGKKRNNTHNRYNTWK